MTDELINTLNNLTINDPALRIIAIANLAGVIQEIESHPVEALEQLRIAEIELGRPPQQSRQKRDAALSILQRIIDAKKAGVFKKIIEG